MTNDAKMTSNARSMRASNPEAIVGFVLFVLVLAFIHECRIAELEDKVDHCGKESTRP